MILILLLAAIIILGGLFILWLPQYLTYRKYLMKYPGPRFIPIIGNMHHFATGTGLVPSLMSAKKKYGDIVYCMFPFSQKLFLMGIKPVGCLLGSTTILEKPDTYTYFHSWLGMGLLTASGARWKQSRKLLTPAFHFKILGKFIDIFEKQSNILNSILEKFDGKEVDIAPFITLCALDVICEATMNTPVNAQFASNSEYVSSVKEMCAIVFRRFHNPLKRWNTFYKFSKDYQKERRALNILHEYSNSVINKRREELRESKLHHSFMSEDEIGIRKKMVFLDLLLDSEIDGKPLPHNMIREEVDTFMFEGHDTSTSAISFTLYCLSRNLEIQEKVLTELRNIVPDDKSLTYDDLQKMKYLELVTKESLRLYPPVPLFARMTSENVDFDGTTLPKGTSLIVFAYGLHRCPKIYPNPDLFDPDRFNPVNSQTRSPYAYVPFSAGPRNCIGQRFAMLEVKAIVANVVRKFRLLEVIGHEPKLTIDAVLRSKNGLPIRIQKRN
ncbi:hypothetical protein RI129_002671 [Pyrocoelia pectoralis]|uniref:Cytochrome P450 n=1 Tax=Pyrocoelia pectoralis TaxID=417401 RepID=A0AAN7VQ27_9COLE